MMFKLKLLLFRWTRKLKQFNYWLWAQAVFLLLGLLRLFPAKEDCNQLFSQRGPSGRAADAAPQGCHR